MITKERLQELIKKGATIYSIESTFNKERCIVKYTLNNHFIETDNNRLIYLPTYNHVNKNENLYEHKADAEWELEFGNVERVEKFVRLPMYEKIKADTMTACFVICNELCKIVVDKQRIRIFRRNIAFPMSESYIVYKNKKTKENYTEACRLFKKLFMGG